MLNTYLAQTARLLSNPAAPSPLYSTADLTAYINYARGQLAGETECIRRRLTLTTVIDQRDYDFSSIAIGTPSATGVQGVINVRSAFFNIASGQQRITPRPWEWFELYGLNNPVPESNAPAMWAQYGQGAAPGSTGSFAGGSLYLDPPPNLVYTLYLDCVCYPIALTSDSDKEAIPYLFTDAVPFFAAYYAFLSSQGGMRQADAERMYNHYQTFVERASRAVNPSVLRAQYERAKDPIQSLKVGVRPTGGPE